MYVQSGLIDLGSWGVCPALQLARQDFQAVVLRNGSSDGEVLAIGGCCNGANSLASSELWSPGDNSWHTSGTHLCSWSFRCSSLKLGMRARTAASGSLRPAHDAPSHSLWVSHYYVWLKTRLAEVRIARVGQSSARA